MNTPTPARPFVARVAVTGSALLMVVIALSVISPAGSAINGADIAAVDPTVGQAMDSPASIVSPAGIGPASSTMNAGDSQADDGQAPITPAATNAGNAQVVDPNTGEPMSSGGKSTAFTLRLPEGAACTGDSPNDDYRVQSYMVPESVDPNSLKYGATGPSPAGTGANFRQPLYTTTSQRYVNAQTAAASTPGGPGPIVNIPAFDFDIYTQEAHVPAGTYNVGIACTLGPADAPDQLDKYWNVQMTFTAGASSWTVPGAPSTTTTTIGATTTTTTGATTTTTTGATTTTTAGATTTTTAGVTTTTTAGATTTTTTEGTTTTTEATTTTTEPTTTTTEPTTTTEATTTTTTAAPTTTVVVPTTTTTEPTTTTTTTTPAAPACDGRAPTIIGSEFDDMIFGTDGPDVIMGMGGNDLIQGMQGDDVVCGGAGSDNISGQDGDDRLFGEEGFDVMTGGLGNDRLNGGDDSDSLAGNEGDDSLFGEAGDDSLSGGTGNDSMSGGDGGDACGADPPGTKTYSGCP